MNTDEKRAVLETGRWACDKQVVPPREIYSQSHHWVILKVSHGLISAKHEVAKDVGFFPQLSVISQLHYSTNN